MRTFVVADHSSSVASAGANGRERMIVSTNDSKGGVTMANAKTYTPKELAAEIGIDPKVLRNYLRKAHTRELTAKNTSWIIPATVANDCRKAFKKNVAGSAKP